MPSFQEYLIAGLKEIELQFTKDQLDKCVRFQELLLSWNEKINLTAITDPEEIAIKHFIDSLMLLKKFNISPEEKILDLGSGAGFPGIPLKIFLPKARITLLDAVEKKCKFLRGVTKELEMSDLGVFHGRGEDFAKDIKFRGKFSLVTARAVTSLPVLAEYGLPFLELGGYIVAMKGRDIDQEVKSSQRALSLLGGILDQIEYFTLPFSEDQRSLVFIKKRDKTPARYPRKAGIPEKRPLL